MDYVFIPPLEQLVVVKLAAMLWNQYDIRDIMSRFCVPLHTADKMKDIEKEWLKLEDKVKEKVPQFPLPKPLKEKIVGFIKPVGLQILKWIEYHGIFLLDIDLPQEFYWTAHGTLDKKRTAELLIKNESIDITVRYRLSCIYCLENSVKELWAKMHGNSRKYFDDEEKLELVVFWTCDIKEKLSRVENIIETTDIDDILGIEFKCNVSTYQYAFEYAANDGNIVAVDYFYHKMTSSEKEHCLVPVAGTVVSNHLVSSSQDSEFLRENYSDVLSFLLSKMNYEQQMELFKNFTCQVLLCLLDWPWQTYFMETANIMWNFFPPSGYDVLISAITNKLMNGHKYFNYQKMLGDIWRQSPGVYKRCTLSEISASFINVLLNLFKIRDENNIRLIFRHATLKEKKRIFDKRPDIWKNLIDGEEWCLLDYVIRECISSKDQLIKFKNSVEVYIAERMSDDEFDRKGDLKCKCLHLLDNIICSFDKIKCVEENCLNPAKRFCISR